MKGRRSVEFPGELHSASSTMAGGYFVTTSYGTRLGHRLIMAQPELGGGQLEHGEEVCGVFFVARGEPSEVFDAVEESLDAVACTIEHRAEAGFPAAMDHWRDVGCGSGASIC